MEILKSIFIAILLIIFNIAPAQEMTVLEKAFSDSYTSEINGKYSQAVISLTKVYDKNSYEINLRLGWLSYMAGQFTESITYYNHSINLKPLSIEARLGITYPASAMGNWTQVMEAYADILKIDPNNYTANLRLGQIYHNRAEYAKAETYFNVVLNQYPFTYDVVINSAWNNYFLGKFREASVLFNKVLMLNPGDQSAKDGLSKIK
jgi:tetratricopeptide (TPR) repeat protein